MLLPLHYYLDHRNVGDRASPLICQWASSYPVTYENFTRPHVLGLGSIFASATNKSLVWGTGIISPQHGFGTVLSENIYALRGKHTADLLTKSGIKIKDLPLGDPGLLLPEALSIPKDTPVPKKYRLGLIPHYVDRSHPWLITASMADDICVLDVHKEPAAFLEDLLACEAIASSSLHGIIFATALRLPAAWLEFSDRVTGGGFKFRDYFSVTNNPQVSPFVIQNTSTFEHLIAACELRPYSGDTNDLKDSLQTLVADHLEKLQASPVARLFPGFASSFDAEKAVFSSTPLISVIMRTRNRRELMRRAVHSVSRQTYPNLELVVVAQEDALTYAEEIVGNEDNGIPYTIIKVTKECSLGGLLNIGVQSANGKWIIALDDDDTWHPECLSKLAHALTMSLYPQPRGAVCQNEIHLEEFRKDLIPVVKNKQVMNGHLNYLLIAELCGQNQFSIHSYLYEKSLWEEVGGYDEELQVAEDWDFNLRCLIKADIIVIPEALANYHIRKSKTTGDSSDQTRGRLAIHHVYSKSHIQNRWLRNSFSNDPTKFQLALAGQLMQLNRTGDSNDSDGSLQEKNRQLLHHNSKLQAQLTATTKKFNRLQAAVEKWNNRSWFKRAFHKLRLNF